MLLFMEYCSEGTVSDAARLGLSEPIIRKYTHDILEAISILHENQVVHRDIKGIVVGHIAKSRIVKPTSLCVCDSCVAKI